MSEDETTKALAEAQRRLEALERRLQVEEALDRVRARALAMRRSEQGEPFLRMILILGGVVVVTLGSALLFETQRMRRLYRLGGSPTQQNRGGAPEVAGPEDGR